MEQREEEAGRAGNVVESTHTRDYSIEDQACLWSKWTLSYLDPILSKGGDECNGNNLTAEISVSRLPKMSPSIFKRDSQRTIPDTSSPLPFLIEVYGVSYGKHWDFRTSPLRLSSMRCITSLSSVPL